MANDENLIPLNKRTKEEQREIAKQGGIKSGKIRREKKMLKDIINIIGTTPLPAKERNKIFPNILGSGIDIDDITYDVGLIIGQYLSGINGDTKAATFIRDTGGQKPNDKVDLTTNIPIVITGEDEIED
ncbi:hypothetical protein [Anaerofustis stercorihominis]|uniref:hypothetical protein n=1 Tax=Anaerofustis stercorihominis TaxID=214853 RepID=UPI003995286E